MKFAFIAALIISLTTAVFAVQNAQPTQVTFLGWYFDGPLVIVLLLTFGSGALATFFASLPGLFRKKSEIAKLKNLLSECSLRLEELERQQRSVSSDNAEKQGEERS